MAEVKERVSALFEADKAAVRAVDGPFLRPWADGEAALSQGQTLKERATTLLALGLGVFHNDQMALLERFRGALEHQALVYYGADLAWQNTVPDSMPRAERKRLAALARLWDGRLMKQARAIFDGDEDIEAILLDIQSGNGIRDDAEDVLRLLALFIERWEAVGARLTWTRAELETLEAEMTALIKVLRPVAIVEQAAAVLRQQAFTRFVRTYNEVLSACRYLARNNPDALAELKGLVPA